jgi:tRNA pseudouridine55 synthase
VSPRRRRSAGGPDGLCVIDKPAGWTSHDVVARLRSVLATGRTGHAGTLDPGATGVLLVGVGSVTRLLRFLTALPKTYVGEVVLGVETDTLDADGRVTATHDMADVTLAQARAAAVPLTGTIEQVPPMVSAVRVEGRRLHEMARAGEEVERAPRQVTVHRFEVAATAAPDVLAIEVTCSSGTYIRTLAADLGAALGGGAHLRGLRRTAIGSFTAEEAVPFSKATTSDDLELLSPAGALRDYAAVQVDEATAIAVGHGRVLAREELGVTGDGPWPLCSAGRLLAVYEDHGQGRAKPAVVLPAGSSG